MIEDDELAAMMDSLGMLVGRATSRDELDAALVEFGWLDLMDESPQAAVRGLFELLGEQYWMSAALSWVMVRAALPDEPGGSLPEWGTVVPHRGWGSVAHEVDDGSFALDGLLLPCAPNGRRVLLPAATATGLRLLVVEREQLKLGPVRGLDPEGGLQRIGGSIEIGRADEAKVGDPEAAWSDAVTAGRRALGHQIAGTITAMLDSAIEHARVREQFGQAIGSYQAVRHRLAETRVALEAARDGLTASWDDDTDHAAICAKALSGRSLRDASRHCQQVLAGMGFSAEHVFPSLYKRGVTLDALLGSSMELTVALGDALASGKRLLPLTGLDHPVSEPIGTSLHRSHRSWR